MLRQTGLLFSGLRMRMAIVALLIATALLTACDTSPTATPVPVATNTPVPVSPTVVEASEAPTEVAQGTATEDTSGGVNVAGATPVSDWKPGAHPNTITAPAKLVTSGTLTVGSDASYPPQEYVDAGGTAVGMDIDIAAEIASRMGLQLKVINFKFDDIIPALNAGQFDVVVSAMTVTDERKQVVDFVPYFEAGQAVLVQKGNPKNIKSVEDLSGKTVAVQSGTVEADTLTSLNDQFTKEGKPTATILTYGVDTDAVDQLRVGRADATMHDSPVAAYYAAVSGNQFEVAVPNFDSAPEGIAVAKTNSDMFKAIDTAITAMKGDGTLDAIKAKWGVK